MVNLKKWCYGPRLQHEGDGKPTRSVHPWVPAAEVIAALPLCHPTGAKRSGGTCGSSFLSVPLGAPFKPYFGLSGIPQHSTRPFCQKEKADGPAALFSLRR